MDRNRACTTIITTCIASLSARRAWIEIVITAMTSQISVDRNLDYCDDEHTEWSSLSARRAWIEIGDYVEYNYNNKSLSARRAWIEINAL